MEFKVLGPLEVADNGRPVSLGGPRQRLVLAHLLLRANQVLAAEQLIDEVWGDDPPDGARGTLQSYVSHLRKALGPERIEGGSAGYMLSADPAEIDAARFEALIRDARTALTGDPAAASDALTRALALWRGRALSDLAEEPSLRADIARLEELRLAAIEQRVEAELALSRHSELVPELQSLIERQPLRERLWAQLMLALVRSGRQADALDAYRRAREVLGEELGIDPSPELQRLHERILKQDPALEIGGTPLRGYRLMDLIGEGEFGSVHRAIQPQVGREVAVKAIHPRLANHPEFIRRFEMEAQLVARIEHPHIVPLYDYWREPDAAYLVMRFMRGGSVKSALGDGPLHVETAARVVEQIAAALAAAHRQGVVHRDVKPANILFDEERNAYLSDFGIATDLTRAAHDRSNPPAAYTSPEELRGEPVTPRSDVYGLGVVAIEMLVGQSPFRGASEREPATLLRESQPALADGTVEVLSHAVAVDPADRYADTTQFSVALRNAIHPRTAPVVLPVREARNPFKGLRAFLEADASDFFGREALVQRLVARLGEPGEGGRLLAVVGPSGSGKSSVVRAGLIPALRAGALPGSDRWFSVEMLPGSHPFEELERALLRVAGEAPTSLLDQLERDANGLVATADRLLPDDGTELVLLVDQFEELFALVEEEDQRTAFLECLEAAVRTPASRVRVVVTLRADFYDRPLLYRGFGDLLAARTEAITPLSTSELERAVSGPAERVGVTVEPRLTADIVSDVAAQAGSLPLLQYALTELFERRSDGVLTLDDYRAIGGVSGALVRRAEDLYSALNEAGRQAARQLFLRLVAVGEEGSDDTRRRVLRAELSSLDVDRDAVDHIIDVFGRRRLLSFDRDPITRGPTVEVAHEALLREWNRFRGWIDAAREDIRMERRLATASAEWSAADRDTSFLLRGGRLTSLRAWSASSDVALTSLEREFLDASVEAHEVERVEEEVRAERERTLERRSLVRMRGLVAVLTLAAVLGASLSVIALGQRHRARQEAGRSAARELATASTANIETDPERSILLALEAIRAYARAGFAPGRDAVEALHHGVGASRVLLTLRSPGAQVDVSPDGSLIATSGAGPGSAGNDATIWEAASGKPVVTLKGHQGMIGDIRFNADGSKLITTASDFATIDNSASLWDVRTGKRLVRFVGHKDYLRQAAISREGKRVATTSGDGTLRIWDAATGRETLRIRPPHEHGPCGVAFSPDATSVASSICEGGGETLIWNARTGRLVLTLPGHETGLALAYSPDGRAIATTGFDGTVKVWDARTGRLLVTMAGHEAATWGVDFSPDGTMLATGSTDLTARLWDVRTGEQILLLRGHANHVRNVAFDGTGTRLVTGSSDGTMKLWDVRPGAPGEAIVVSAGARPAASVTYSSDGRRLLVAAGSVSLWDARSGDKIATLPRLKDGPLDAVDATFAPDGTTVAAAGSVGGEARVALWDTQNDVVTLALSPPDPMTEALSAVISPDGRTLVATGSNEFFTVWDVSSGELVRTFDHFLETDAPEKPVYRAAFSPDGSRLATASWDKSAKVWDIVKRYHLATYSHSGRVNGVAYSADGKRIVTASTDGTALVWDVRSGRRLATMRSRSGMLDADFSPNGKLVATAGADGKARLWNASSGEEVLSLAGSSSGANEVAFSPDGTRLAVAGSDGTIRVYLLQVDELIALARTRVTRDLTEDECRQYLHLDRCPSRS